MYVSRLVLTLCLVPVVLAWVNTNVERKLDLSQSIVRTVSVVTMKNDGSSASDELEWAVPVSNLTAITKKSLKVDKVDVSMTETSRKDGYAIYKVKLNAKVGPGETVTLKHRVCYGGVLRPLPPTVKQGENQFVDYLDNAYFLSRYETVKQTTTVKVSPNVVSHSDQPSPVTKKGDSVVYGEYKNVKPMSTAPLRVHFQNNSPFVTAHSVRRVIEVSMWGNLAVEEWYQIENTGAKLKGAFSRLDYQKTGRAPSSFTTLRAALPALADDIYFRDDIGNISTSRVNNPEGKTKIVDFTQRFPLFGGWRTRFYFGYNLPLSNVLTVGAGVNRLRVPYASPIQNLFIKNMTLEVVLPEGVPRPIVRIDGKETQGFEVVKRSTYLDYSGRTVVVLSDSMLSTPERNEQIELDFKFSKGDLLWEPLYLVVAFMALFTSIIFLSRIVA